MARSKEDGEVLKVKLLRELQNDSDRKNKEVANDLGIDPSTLSRLKDRLETEGYITYYRAVLNPRKFGLNTIAFIKIALEKTDSSHLKSTVKFLTNQMGVQEIHMIEGDYDIFIKIRVKSNEDVWKISQKLSSTNNIKDT